MTIKKQSAWGLWWLTVISLGVYYFVWYARINKELDSVLGAEAGASAKRWSQLIPFYGLYALAKTAGRVNAADAAVGSPTRVGTFTTWFWATSWFGSHTRYLQRRLNILHDIQASHTQTVLV